MTFRILVAAALLSMTAFSSASRAAEVGAAAEAERLLGQGLSLREQGNDADALPLFEKAHSMSPSPRTMAQIGLCEQALGRWVVAEEHVKAALAAPGDPWIRKHRVALEGALRTLAQHLGTLEIVGGVPGAEVFVGDQRVATLPLAKPLRVVAGTSVLQVRALGYVPISRPLVVSPDGLARETVELTAVPVVEIPVRRVEKPADSPPPEAAKPPPIPDPAAAAQAAGRARRVSGAVGVGLGLALVGGGLAAYGIREQRAAEWNDDDRCLVNGLSREENCAPDRKAVELAQTLETVGLTVGGVVTAVSVLLIALPDRKRSGLAARLDCASGPGLIGISCGGRF